MRKFGLIGYPLSHSFSKKYFSEKFAREGIEDCSYDLFPITDISQLPQLVKDHDLEGLNVTIPYKKHVIQYLESASKEVIEMQACNCISIIKGKLLGNNTDVTGFEKTFTPNLKPHHKKALILGTGGAASAVQFTLRKLGIDYLLVSRQAAGHNQITYSQLTEELIREYSMIINTTPLGTYPDINSFPAIPYNFITPQHYLYDLVYNPAKTLFLKKGEERGATIENGANMLVIQAEESWNIWNKDNIN